MLQPDCEPTMQAVHMLTQEIAVVDDQIQALVTEGLNQQNPLQYLRSQIKIDHLIGVKHALQDEWNSAMNELAICRSTPTPAH